MSITLEPCRWAYVGGKLCPAEHAAVPIDNHAVHFGSAAFESLRLYRTALGPRVVGIEQHLDRFTSTMAMLKLAPIDREEVRRAFLDVVAANDLEDGYIRVLAYPAGGCSRLDPAQHTTQLLILAWRVNGTRFAPPLTLGVSAIRRPPAYTSLPRAKHSGMYGIYAAMHSAARGDGFDDALVLHADGTVCEVTGANIFLVRDGALATPPIPDSIDGVTRRLTMTIAQRVGIGVEERPLSLDDFFEADEIFITGTFHGLRAVSAIDGRTPRHTAPGPMTSRLQAAYEELLEAPSPEDAQWVSTIAPHGRAANGRAANGRADANGIANGTANGSGIAHANGIAGGGGIAGVNGSAGTNGHAHAERRFRVRPADRADVPQVLEAIRLLLEELRGVPGITLPAGAETVCRRTIEGRARGAIFVAAEEGGHDAQATGNGAAGEPARLIGVLSLSVLEAIHTGGAYGLIQDLWVLPEHRSDGVGAALVATAEAYCRDHRLATMEVCLPSHRFPRLPRTHSFYQSCGFIELGPRMRKEVS